MRWHKEIWTYIVVTLVAVLIWAWAAGETRERLVISVARVRFVVEGGAGGEQWLVSQPGVNVQASVEGPKLAVQNVERLLREGAEIHLEPRAGTHSIELVNRLRENARIKDTGATIVATDPPSITINVDKLDEFSLPIKAALPGVTPEGPVTVTPAEAHVRLPHALSGGVRDNIAVEAFVARSDLDRLQEGVPQTVDAKLRLPEDFPGAGSSDVRISPSSAKVTFTIRSRVRETPVDSMRVQIAGPAEDAYLVEVEPKVLRGITVMADADLSRQIESGDVPVIALVHLRSSEKEALIDHKAVSMLVALVPDLKGGTRYVPLTQKEGVPMPVINLKISPRAAAPAPS